MSHANVVLNFSVLLGFHDVTNKTIHEMLTLVHQGSNVLAPVAKLGGDAVGFAQAAKAAAAAFLQVAARALCLTVPSRVCGSFTSGSWEQPHPDRPKPTAHKEQPPAGHNELIIYPWHKRCTFRSGWVLAAQGGPPDALPFNTHVAHQQPDSMKPMHHTLAECAAQGSMRPTRSQKVANFPFCQRSQCCIHHTFAPE